MKFSLLALLLAFALTLGVGSAVSAGPLLGDADADGHDDLWDNCFGIANANQIDTDGDGCGNACDADYDQSGTVGASDFSIFRGAFIAGSPGNPGYNANVDHNGDGPIGAADFTVFRAGFINGVPGPSKLAGRVTPYCP
jgi:uncharacterized membrane protein